mgnify:CR=1 FL=1
MAGAAGALGVTDLPPELLAHIFAYLPARDLLRAACVCRAVGAAGRVPAPRGADRVHRGGAAAAGACAARVRRGAGMAGAGGGVVMPAACTAGQVGAHSTAAAVSLCNQCEGRQRAGLRARSKGRRHAGVHGGQQRTGMRVCVGRGRPQARHGRSVLGR